MPKLAESGIVAGDGDRAAHETAGDGIAGAGIAPGRDGSGGGSAGAENLPAGING